MNQTHDHKVIGILGTIIVALIGLIGVIYNANVAANVALENMQRPMVATMTAEAKHAIPTSVQVITQATMPFAPLPPTATNSPLPTATNRPLPTNTPIPLTKTSAPTATFTAVPPTVTFTQMPATATTMPATNTSLPTATDIPKPIKTFTPVPPTSTFTPQPTNTPMPVVGGNCPFRTLADEINTGDNTGACATLPLTKFLKIMEDKDLYSAIQALDRAFEMDIRAGYQFRVMIPAQIPPAPARQRVMWGGLTWIDDLPADQKNQINSRIYRIRCNFTNPCIYVILDSGKFNVNFSGRGIVVSEPLSDEVLQGLSQ